MRILGGCPTKAKQAVGQSATARGLGKAPSGARIQKEGKGSVQRPGREETTQHTHNLQPDPLQPAPDPQDPTLQRSQMLTVPPEPAGEQHTGDMKGRVILVLLRRQAEPAIAIEQGSILGDISQDPGSAPEEQKAIPLQHIRDPGIGFRRGTDQVRLHKDPLSVTKDPEPVGQKVDVITDTPDKLVYEVK